MENIQSTAIPLSPALPGRTRRSRRRGRSKAILGGCMVGAVVLTTLLSVWITPYDPNATSLSQRLAPGIWAGNLAHPFGTDQLGRDMLSRVMAGGRVSLTIAFLAVLGSGVIGTVLGLVAGYTRGLVDNVLGIVSEIQLALPGILLIMLFLGVLGPSVFTLAFVLAIEDWIGLFRVTRSRTLVEKAREYTDAARVIGASHTRIIFRHLLPNLMPTVIVLTTLSIASVVLAEAGLSFLGLGVQRPFPSWGRMIADGQEYLLQAWWVSTIPALVVAVVVLGVNILGDGLRELTKAE